MEKLFYKLIDYLWGISVLGSGCYFLNEGMIGYGVFMSVMGTLCLSKWFKTNE